VVPQASRILADESNSSRNAIIHGAARALTASRASETARVVFLPRAILLETGALARASS